MRSEVPSGWFPSTVGNCCDILDSERVPLNSEQRRVRQGNIPYWGANGVIDHIDDYIFDEPLLLLAEDGGYFDQAHTRPICHLVNGKSWVNNHAHVMRVRSENLREYVYYWFVHRDITRFINSGTRSKLNQADLRKLPLLLPPLPEQKKIAAILSSVDEAIQATQAVIDQTRKVKEGLLQDLLTRGIGHTRFKQTEIGEIPEGWEVATLEKVADFKNGKAHERDVEEEGKFILLNSKFISSGSAVAKYTNERHCPVVKMDIVMVMSDVPNGRALARCFLIPDSHNYTLNQRICALTAHSCSPHFLYYVLDRNRYFLSFDSGVGQTNLRRQEVCDCPIPLPPPREQERIVEILLEVDEVIERETALLGGLNCTKAGLLQDLLTGKVRVSV